MLHDKRNSLPERSKLHQAYLASSLRRIIPAASPPAHIDDNTFTV